MNELLKATYLFERPTRTCHNSESWWTALFSIVLLHLAKHPKSGEIITKEYRRGPVWAYCEAGGLDLLELSFSEVFVEPKLTAELFQGLRWPKDFWNLVPDIVISRPKRRRTIFIENKTTGANIRKRQLKDYLGAIEYLKHNDWNAELVYLMSIGYQPDREWNLIEENRVRVILWEDVLRVIDGVECFRSLFDVELPPFDETPRRA